MSDYTKKRQRESGYILDADARSAERKSAKPVVGKHRVGQRVMLDVGDQGQPWGVILALELDKARLRLDGGGVIVAPRAMLRGAK